MTTAGHYPRVGADPKSLGANLLKCVPTWNCTLPATLKRSTPGENKNCFPSAGFAVNGPLELTGIASHCTTTGFSAKRLGVQQVRSLKDVRDVSPISSLILGLGWALWSTRPCLKETLIGF